jgi:glycosyltransferase involved in cell wall biosynthesis
MQIWDRIQDIPLVVMGGGPLEEEFRAWAETKDNVLFLGYTQHDKCLSIVKKAEFVVFPSIWYEGCSMVEIEAESLGKGLIATDLGFSEEAIYNGVNGFKVPLGSVDSFEQTIRKLWADPDQIAVIGKNARMDYEAKYLPEDNYRQLERIYNVVTKET